MPLGTKESVMLGVLGETSALFRAVRNSTDPIAFSTAA